MSEKQPPPYSEQQPLVGAPPPNTTVVVTQPAIQPVVFRDIPVVMTDASGNQFTTQLEYRSGAMTWIVAGVLLILGFWCCFCIPFCIDSFKDVYHINPNNGSVVGVYKRA